MQITPKPQGPSGDNARSKPAPLPFQREFDCLTTIQGCMASLLLTSSTMNKRDTQAPRLTALCLRSPSGPKVNTRGISSPPSRMHNKRGGSNHLRNAIYHQARKSKRQRNPYIRTFIRSQHPAHTLENPTAPHRTHY